MNKQTLIWQAIVFILGLIFILGLREYGVNLNEIKARTATADCISDMKNAFPSEVTFAPCVDIKTYKIKNTNNSL